MGLAVASTAFAATNDLSGLLQKGLFEEEANRNLDAASAAYETLVKQFDKDRQIGATAIFRLGEVYRKQGKTNEAAAQYERIVRDFAEQTTLVTLSRQNLAGLGTQSSLRQSNEAAPGPWQRVATAEYEQAKQLLEQIKSLSREEMRQALPTLVPDARLSELQTQLDAVVAKQAETEQDFGPESPAIKKLVATREVLNKQMDERIAGIIKALHLKVTMLEATVSQTERTKSSQVAVTTTVVDEEETEIRRIQTMIQNSPDLINAASGDPSRTPLGQAAEKGQLRVAEYLLNNGADVNTSASGSPLAIAARNGHKKMVELLLARGAAVDAVDSERRTPLHVAVTRNYPAVVESLLAAKADPNAKDNGDNTPLMAAVRSGSLPMAQALLSRGADPNGVNKVALNYALPDVFRGRTNYGSALHFAAGRGSVALTRLLLTNQADVTLRSVYGETALHVAAANDRAETAVLLIAAGAEVNARGAEAQTGGATPLHLATSARAANVVKLLLENKADPNATAVYYGGSGVTPLMLAANGDDVELITLLLKYKADPNQADAIGTTALLNAIQRGNTKTVQVLLAGGANPDTQTGNGSSALVKSVIDTVGTEVVTALVAAKANVNAADPNGTTPLHHAVHAKRQDLVELLVQAGADINWRDKNGKTALDYAKGNNRSGGIPVRMPTPISMPSVSPSASAATKPEDMATLLRKHGALDNLPAFDRIQITRPTSGLSKTIFTKGRIEVSSFTLLDVLGVQYQFLNQSPVGGLGKRDDTRLLAMNDFRSDAFSFPDLTKVRLRRPSQDGKKWDERVVDVAALLRDGDCSQNIALKWGDEIVIPETDHGLGERWDGFSRAGLKAFNKCLTRTVEIVVKGQPTKISIGPKFEYLEGGSQPYVTTEASLWLRPVLYGSNLLLASSDLTRVRVKRIEPGANKPREWVLDCSVTSIPEFWLRDGDVIEVPDKP